MSFLRSEFVIVLESYICCGLLYGSIFQSIKYQLVVDFDYLLILVYKLEVRIGEFHLSCWRVSFVDEACSWSLRAFDKPLVQPLELRLYHSTMEAVSCLGGWIAAQF